SPQALNSARIIGIRFMIMRTTPMAGRDDFKDSSGFLMIFLGLAALIFMACLPATVRVIQLITG
ncbi:MAG TPA: hypothetical protein VK991_11200, partial [Halomonas sp.]|nr:hypothetical protein [Halomonas sp.]